MQELHQWPEGKASECLLPVEAANILVADDDQDIREIMQDIIQSEGHTCRVAPDGEAALGMIHDQEPDVLITDVDMPKLNGIELMKKVRAEFDADIIVMTGFAPHLSYSEFIELGASDFVQKPVMPSEMVTRLNRVLRERCYKAAALSAHQELMAAHEELQSSYLDTIHRLVMAAEYKDEDTGDHIVRIGRFCALIAAKAGLADSQVEIIGYASPMHDIGKIGIPDQILLKPGKLTGKEFDTIKTHTTIGAKLLARSKSEIIRCAQQVAIAHHERWDGSGYPQGQVGVKIPIVGRITAIADTFDALTSRRPYKAPYPIDLTLEIMQKERGRQFDPELLDLFIDNLDAVIDIKQTVKTIETGGSHESLLSERDRASLGA